MNLQKRTTLDCQDDDISIIHSGREAQKIDILSIPNFSLSELSGSNDRVISSFLNSKRANRDIFEATTISKKILIVDD